jgi:hypothetical protein
MADTDEPISNIIEAWRGMASAPRDGRITVEVRHGPDQETVQARWFATSQAWVRDDDIARKALVDVVAWRPVEHNLSN